MVPVQGDRCGPGVEPRRPADRARPCRELLARLLRAWLRAHRDPLKVVAGQLGVAVSTVSQWAHGRRFPRPEELDRLALQFGVSPGCLLCPHLPQRIVRRGGSDARRGRRTVAGVRSGRVTVAAGL